MDNITDHDSGLKDIDTVSTNSTDGYLSPEYHAAAMMWKVCSPCILLLGGFGNIATIFVMCRIKDNKSTQHIILMALAVSDFLLLSNGLLRQWLDYGFHVYFQDSHSVACKVLNWIQYSCCNASAWLLTAVTVQRTMAVKYPLKMRRVCSLQRTWFVITAIVLIAFSQQFHCVLGIGISTENLCPFLSAWYINFSTVWSWIDMCFSSILPTICLLVCDVILSLTLFKTTSSTTTMTFHGNFRVNIAQGNDYRRKIASRTTVMVLALSCTFLVLTLPLHATLIRKVCGISHVASDITVMIFDDLPFAMTSLLFYTNSAVNFLLYCFTGTKFRREFLKWICCRA